MMPKKTAPGQPFSFSASFYNKLVDTVRWADTQKKLSGAGQAGGVSSPVKLMVKNESGSLVGRFEVLEVSNTIGATEDFENLKAIRGVTPTSALLPVVITQASALDDEVVECIVGGTTMARVNVSATTDTHAEPVAGSTVLRSGTAGRFRILHPLVGTGEQSVLVRFESASSAAPTLPQVRNDSGETIPEWGFLLVDGVTVSPTADLPQFKSSPVFRGTLYNSDNVFHNKRLVAVPGGVAPGETADCVVSGIVPARIYSATDPNPLMCHWAYDVTSVNKGTRLVAFHNQSNYGFPILYRESGTGEKWGLIDLAQQNGPAAFYCSIRDANTVFIDSDASTTWTGNPFYGNGGTVPSYKGGSTIVDAWSWPDRIGVEGYSEWFGEAVIQMDVGAPLVTMASLPSLKKSDGMSVSVEIVGINGGVIRSSVVKGTLEARVVEATGATMLGSQKTFTIPFYFQAPSGRYADTGAGFQVKITIWKSPLVVGKCYASLDGCSVYMHEIDPCFDSYLQWRPPYTGTIPGGGVSFTSGSGDRFSTTAVAQGSTISGADLTVATGDIRYSVGSGVSSGIGLE